ncbi:hypothetical protein L2E82_44181 [Cichorium intybus]|uniref:Uncharacterized protein n=1 Tax=Cichorium intybus TaxID=13427 RepID=A0ACB8ZQ24_CICIN|nr:hypothetical protein L2E82_44181 [Cichorium intybus]
MISQPCSYSPDLDRTIKAALAPVSEHIVGLLPLHLVYNQAHDNEIEVIFGDCRVIDIMTTLITSFKVSNKLKDQQFYLHPLLWISIWILGISGN